MIELDLGLIKAYNLTIEEYVLLDLMRMKFYGKIRKFFTDDKQLVTLLDKLVLLGHLKRNPFDDPNTLGGYTLQSFPRYTDKFVESLADEIINTYPQKVIRPDGTTGHLRSNVKVLREQYKKIVNNNKEKHKLILDCLKYQIEEMTRQNKLPYMKSMSKWLENEEWRNYEAIIISKGEDSSIEEKDEDIYGKLVV